MKPDDTTPSTKRRKRLSKIAEALIGQMNPAMKPFVNRLTEYTHIAKTDAAGTRVMLFVTQPDKTNLMGEFAGFLIEGSGIMLIGSVNQESFSVAVDPTSLVLETSLQLRGVTPNGSLWYLRHVVLTDAQCNEIFSK